MKQRFKEEVTGHDWLHMERVRYHARYIWEKERTGDPLYIDLVALLHDVDDDKLASAEEDLTLKDWLTKKRVPSGLVGKLLKDTANISFRKGERSMLTVEAKIVQDADRLDAIGAIGIARAFAYGSKNGQLLCKQGDWKQETRQKSGSTVAHFYDKLLLIKDLMNTETGRKMAEERHAFLQSYLCQFEKEWKE